MIVNPGIVVELKAAERPHPLHEAQLVSDLRATGMRRGLLPNVNCTRLKDGLKRIVC